MTEFAPNKRHLREILLFCFNSKKKAPEAHRLITQAYGESALCKRQCREWYRRFKKGDFDVEDKPRSGQPKKFEDAELKALLEQDPSQTQEQLAETLGVTQAAVSKRLITLGLLQKH